jgi:multiple sugar transport system substrate-binding protein
MPGIRAQIGEDFGVLPWPALDAEGRPATFWGGWSEMVNPKGENKNVAEAKKLLARKDDDTPADAQG